MKLELIIIIQNFIFFFMDMIICTKTLSKRIQSKTQRIFFTFAVETSLLQLSVIIGKLIQYKIIPDTGYAVQYIVYSSLMVLLCLCGHTWFEFFLVTIPGHKTYSLPVKIFEFSPVLAMTAACIASPWTHWVFYIDSGLNYQRGTLFILQTIIPYCYLIGALVIILIYIIKKQWKVIKTPFINFFCFIAPSFFGAVLQVFVYSGGYTQIGISFGLLIMYLNLYVEELKEIEKLQGLQQVNNQLHEANERISQAFTVIDGLSQEYHTIWIVDRESFQMQLVRTTGNNSITEIIELAKKCPDYETLTKMYIDLYVMEQDQDRLRKELNINTINTQIENSDDVYAVNYLRRKPDGTVGYHQAAIVKSKSDNGKKQFVLGFRDVDSVVKSEIESRNKLIKIQERDKLQLETIGEAIRGGFKTGLQDKDYTITFVSKQLAAMLGYTVEEFMEASGGKMTGIADVEEAAKCIAAARRAVKNGEMYTMNYKMRCKDGSWKNVEERGRGIINSSGIIEYWSFLYDRDEIAAKEKALQLAEAANKALEESKEALIKATESAEAANSAKTSFLFNMSHDIRTPMNAIIGFTDLLEKNQEDSEKRNDYINKIKDSSSVLLSILNNVLEMARIEKGTLELVETVCTAEYFNESLLSVFDQMMAEKNITYTRNFDVKNKYIYCDPIKMKEIMINIISNAYKYTNEGGSVDISVKELPYDKEGWTLYQSIITDTGVGMSEEYLPHLFEEFSREKNTTATKIEGTGLGMSIVKRLLDFMNGTIEVKSELGKGTTFIITIPHRIGSKSDISDQITSVDINSNIFTGKRILLAEDNELNSEIAVAILTEQGFQVETASDGKICVDMLSNSNSGYYDVILMDVQMPNMNGYEATKIIRSMSDKDKAEIPILAMTANAFEEDRQEALNSGMNGHLAKPIDIDQMKINLARVISK